MKEYIEERAVEIACYIIEHKATVRQTAKRFGVSKSTIHKDVTDRLLQINPSLAAEARKILDVNKSERHIRGGLATREKYKGTHHMAFVDLAENKRKFRKNSLIFTQIAIFETIFLDFRPFIC